MLSERMIYILNVYPALFYQEENGISVVFPDLNHLSTCGDDIQEAMEMADVTRA